MASRESLIESHAEECESDDTILMSQVSFTCFMYFILLKISITLTLTSNIVSSFFIAFLKLHV